MVAHDLRNPLSAITLRAVLMRKETDLARVQQQSDSIVNVAMRMDHLIKTMLEVATIEAGKFSVTPNDAASTTCCARQRTCSAPLPLRSRCKSSRW
jgi:signal transduction histidine kinase